MIINWILRNDDNVYYRLAPSLVITWEELDYYRMWCNENLSNKFSIDYINNNIVFHSKDSAIMFKLHWDGTHRLSNSQIQDSKYYWYQKIMDNKNANLETN